MVAVASSEIQTGNWVTLNSEETLICVVGDRNRVGLNNLVIAGMGL